MFSYTLDWVVNESHITAMSYIVFNVFDSLHSSIKRGCYKAVQGALKMNKEWGLEHMHTYPQSVSNSTNQTIN